MAVTFGRKKDVTVCDICGGRITVPPGIIYRGRVMHKNEALRMRAEDYGVERKAPDLISVEQEIQGVLNNPTGTTT